VANPGRAFALELNGGGGDRFALDLVGYQFPNSYDNEWDANWLQIAIQAAVGGRAWRRVDPSLLTTDVSYLADWLDAVAAGPAEHRVIDFTEPNLAFESLVRTGNEVTVRIRFEQESRPDWAPPDDDFHADLALSPEQLITAAADLRAQLRRFPPREVGQA